MCQNCELPVVDENDILLKAARHASDALLFDILVAAGVAQKHSD